jgi:dTDP-D-glucose 4,6-dehydratase
MEALVLKDYLQKQPMILILLILHPKRAQITLLGLMVKRMVLPYVLTNCSNNYGPFHFQKTNSTIHYIIQNKPLPVYGDGKYTRDWLL